ncbi:MAG: cation diffusion facilitator family transporter [Prolixibacteraceae bacterium]
MAHSHETNQISKKKLLITIILNLVITAAQIAGGLISGSLALISDAVHNLSDSISIILAYIAQILSGKPVTQKSTFGYKRAETLAAFINSVVLIGISVYLVIEAIERIQSPQQVDAKWMFWLGLLGLIANGISVLILYREKNRNLNIKAAYLHLMGDALTSLAVVAGAVLIWLFQIYWIDPAVTILISIYLFVHSFELLKESVVILMQMAPSQTETSEIKKRLKQEPALKNVHHIHLWKLTDKIVHFECHAELKENLKVSETGKIFETLQKILHDEFDIEHVTIQFEHESSHEEDCEG